MPRAALVGWRRHITGRALESVRARRETGGRYIDVEREEGKMGDGERARWGERGGQERRRGETGDGEMGGRGWGAALFPSLMKQSISRSASSYGALRTVRRK